MSDEATHVREERRSWHLDKTFSLSHLLSTIAAITALVVMGSKFDTRVSLLEQQMLSQKADQSRQDNEATEMKKSIKEDLRDITAKIDRLIERTAAK